MRVALSAAVGGILILGATTTVGAHHSFAAEFDINRPIQLIGTVTKIEWINPQLMLPEHYADRPTQFLHRDVVRQFHSSG